MTPLLRTLLAGGALLVTAGAAHADTAIATTALNVRAGPGTSYPVIDTLPEGEAVNVLGCTGSWCEISMGAQGTGFASASYLDRAGGPSSRSTVVIDEYEPEVITGLSIGGYWDSRPYYYDDGFYYWGGRWYSERPGRSGWERSWRRDHHRGRHHGRGGWDRPGRGDGPGRPGRGPDRGGDRGDRGGWSGDRGDRGGDRGNRGGDRGDRGGRGGGDIFSGDRGGRGGGDRIGGGGDRGDRMGLDRAGGGGRGMIGAGGGGRGGGDHGGRGGRER